MERLIKNEILPYLDFTDLNICVNCIKGKLTNIQRKEPQEALIFLKLCILIIENILMLILSERKKYFITFIDDCSCYDCVYLLHEKSQAVDALEIE